MSIYSHKQTSIMKKHTITFIFALCMPFIVSAQQSGNTVERPNKVGNMSLDEFEKINSEGAAQVFALKPTNAPLSNADKELMMKIVKGGMMQLAISRAAVEKVTRPETRELAQAEVQEQSGLSGKLQEIAIAKGIQLPTETDSETQAMLDKMKSMSGSELDAFYISESGIKGHEKLEKVMATVQSQAKDSNLKNLASIALPLIRTHLQVSRATQGSSKTTGSQSKSSGQ